jgi:hypothetical protein
LTLFHRTVEIALSLRRNPLLRILFAALGITTLFLFWLITPAVLPSHSAFYHWSGTARSFYVPIALDFIVFWLLLTLLLWIARFPGRLRVLTWGGLLLFGPWIVLSNLKVLLLPLVNNFIFFSPSWTRVVAGILFLIAIFSTTLFTMRWRSAYAARFERVISSATTILICTGIFGCYMLCKLAYYGWQASSVTDGYKLHHVAKTATIQPHRIVWIIFDELSHDQVYEHRFRGLQLPAFDALAKEATVFSNVVPIDIHTEVVIPGLLTGIPVDKIQPSASGQLSVHNAKSGNWQIFNQHDTVFQDALNAGYSTGVVGVFNPYCRLLPGVLNNCYWIENQVPRSGTVLSNMLAPAFVFLNSFAKMAVAFFPSNVRISAVARFPILAGTRERSAVLHIEDFQDLYAASDRLLRDRSADFIFLHLPIPHPAGIYNRATAKLTTSPSTYIDNLALTDKCLAGLRAALEQTGQWDSSTVIIMGDHSWRSKQIWKTDPTTWSAEEEQASHGGQYDPRPAYIVKLAGQTTGTRIDTSFQAVNTRKLFDELLAHQINTPADLSTWSESLH